MDDLSDGDLVTGVPEEDEEFDAPAHSGPILEGSRNKTLSHYAGRILKKYGLSDDRSFQVFMEYVNKCDPPLPKDEGATIWNSATHFYTTKVMTSDGYVPPEEYNDEFGSAGMKPEDYWWYLDLRRYGGCKHAGFGLGFERLVMYLTGMQNIRDVLPFPRTVGNCDL